MRYNNSRDRNRGVTRTAGFWNEGELDVELSEPKGTSDGDLAVAISIAEHEMGSEQ